MYDNILFDLDGTLTDPGVGITNSVMYALKQFGIEPPERKELYKFIGPPLKDSFSKYYNFSDIQCDKAIEEYRVYFRDKGLFENYVYEGIPEMLKTLNDNGKKLVLATSKPEEYAIKILEHFGLYRYFHTVGGASMDGSRSVKSDVILYALKKANITDLSSTVMIGDRKHDIIGAKTAYLDSIGVLYGYGSHDELSSAGATHIAKNVSDIIELILKK